MFRLNQAEQRGPTVDTQLTRREVLSRLGSGFGGLALASLLQPKSWAGGPQVHNLQPRQPHFPAKARAVIQLFMHGGPSHLDLFDPKPVLDRYDGRPPPPEAVDNFRLTGNLLKSPFRFNQHGQSGLPFSEIL